MAGFAELALVRIIPPVTGDACRFRLPVRFFDYMTIGTRNIFVCTAQNEIRQGVVECCFVEIDNIHIPAFMVSVATRAVRSLRRGEATVKACVIGEVAPDFRMACDTQFALRPIRQWLVAIFTFFFQIGVTGNDRARH